jgi:hypothetical protein
MSETDDYHRSPDFYRAVAAVLLAGDVQARVVSNAQGHWIEVQLIDGSRVLWSNDHPYWGYTIVLRDTALASAIGSNIIAGRETLPCDVAVEDAAKMIAMHDYPAPAAYPGAPE